MRLRGQVHASQQELEFFGLLAFATALVGYLSIIMDYGFNISATRSISINRKNSKKINEIFSSVMQIKFILMFLSLFILIVLILVFEKLTKDWEIYLLTFGTVIGQFLFPIWFFQGMEKMKYITYLNILSKSIFTISIFIFVQEKNDFYLVPFLNSLGYLVAGIWSIIVIKKDFNIRFEYQSIDVLKYYFKEGWYIFVTTLSGNLYSQGNIIILGLFVSSSVVGYYSLAQKIVAAVISIFQVIAQAILPFLSKLRESECFIFLGLIKKFIFFSSIANFILIGSIFIFKSFIYQLISTSNDYIGYFSFSFWLYIGFITIENVILSTVLFVIGQDKYLSKIYLFIGFFFILFSVLLTYLYSYKGMLTSMLIVESFIFIFSIIAIIKGFKIYRLENKI